MAMTEGQVSFDDMLGAFLVDLNGDGKPDAIMPQQGQPPRIQVAQSRPDDGLAARGMKSWIDYNAMTDEERAARDAERRGLIRQMRAAYPAKKDAAPTTQSLPTTPQSWWDQPVNFDGISDAISSGGNLLMRGLGQAGGLADYYTMGALSTAAGLINGAIPGQPLGGLNEAKAASRAAQDELMTSRIGRDLMMLPEAFAGMGPGSFSNATARMRNALMPEAPPPPARGTMQGVPNVYQKPAPYYPNEIKPTGSTPPPGTTVTPREASIDFYTDLYRGDDPGTQGRALIDRIGSNRANMPIFTDNNRFAPYSLAEIKARVAAGDAEAAAHAEAMREEYRRMLDYLNEVSPLRPSGPAKGESK